MLGLYLLPLANMYDVVMPSYIPACAYGCAPWKSAGSGRNQTNESQALIDAMFATAGGSAAAGTSCAMPANQSGAHECDCGVKDGVTYMTDSYAGPWCFCADGPSGGRSLLDKAYCMPPAATIEQLNLQIAGPTTVVASFVTYEPLPSAAPVGMIGKSAGSMAEVKGVTHEWVAHEKYVPTGTRRYLLHYIKFERLSPRTRYFYKVKSGGGDCSFSETFSFRSGYDRGVTRLATYGDMGHSRFNNMGNLRADCASEKIDAIVHMGDHAYNLGFAGDRRGDAYMNAMQPVTASCPWYPIIGNHEANFGAPEDATNRYMQLAWGEEYGQGAINPPGARSSATSALGEHLSKSTMYASVHGPHVPSNTSRYTATDFGLIHIAGIDLMFPDDAQLAWLEADLRAAAANRKAVPWIMVTSHIPLYHAALRRHEKASAAHFLGESGEVEIEGQPLPRRAPPRLSDAQRGGVAWDSPALPLYASKDGHAFVDCATARRADGERDADGEATGGASACRTVGEWQSEVIEKVEPLLLKYGVDIFNAGHVHDYEATWPIKAGVATQQDYVNPKGVVHITEGNGGVPGCHGNHQIFNCTNATHLWCRAHANGAGYGRLVAHNATHLTYSHVQNNGGVVTDEFTIVQKRHGPFV